MMMPQPMGYTKNEAPGHQVGTIYVDQNKDRGDQLKRPPKDAPSRSARSTRTPSTASNTKSNSTNSDDQPARKGRTWRAHSPFFGDTTSNFNTRNAEPTVQYVYMQTQEEIMRQQDEILKGLREQQLKQKERELARLSGAGTVVTAASSLMTAHGDRGVPKKDHQEPLPPPPKNVVVAKGDLKQKLDRRMDKNDKSESTHLRAVAEKRPKYKSERSERSGDISRSSNEDPRRRETSERSRRSSSTSESNGQSCPSRSMKSREQRSSGSSLSASTISSAHVSRGGSTISSAQPRDRPPKKITNSDHLNRIDESERTESSRARKQSEKSVRSSHSQGSGKSQRSNRSQSVDRYDRLRRSSGKKDSSRRSVRRPRRRSRESSSRRSSSRSSKNRQSSSSITSHSTSSKSASSFGSYPGTNAFTEAMATFLADSHANIAGFNSEKEMENRIAEIVWGKFRDSKLSQTGMKTDSSAVSSTQLSSTEASSHGPPKDCATIVLTDVQGSTSIWEANPQAMQEALDVHDKILRKNCASYNGYEIDTEGDAFFLAFHTPMDAFGFALKTQLDLYETDWSPEILEIPVALSENAFRGLRVRMGIHQGPVKSCQNEVTGRTEYVGEAMNLAKCIEGMTHGGQILTTFDTWNAASYKAESSLNSPQVLDLGCHVLTPKGDAPVERRILQLVPASLSYDYFAARRQPDVDGMQSLPAVKGRQFPPAITEEQVTASFHDAPHENHEVTIAFVYFSEIENQYENPKPIISDLIRLVGDLLVGTRGYHSQSNMLAFPDINEAVEFGLALMEELKEKRITADYSDLSEMIKFGCVHDTFLTMGPHKTTGRADYFGKVVNRAARITAKSALGTVNFGVLADNDGKTTLPRLKEKFVCHFKGVKELKGVQEEMGLYEVTLDTKENVPLGLLTYDD
mmetsp:Transcript_30922/g.47158  ORF Transcript_30922/g.47158 Transcript_30922/m.47158 type:complete len:916 (-) Transcript_30922:74-2821(-)